MSTKRAILVGAGGFGSVWVREFLPAFKERLVVAALVDVDPQVLERAGDGLGVAPRRRFTSIESAFDTVEADLCILVIQPFLRRKAVELAVSRGLQVLAEKPIADSWETALDLARLSRDSRVKMAICQNYPYTSRIATLKRVLAGGELGRVNYIVARFAADYTIHSAGGAFRHQIPYAMLYEGAVHHFDQLRNLAGADGRSISGVQWNPPWSTFENAPTGLFLLEMANGVACQFELNHLARGAQNGWHHEAYRVECELGVAEVRDDDVVRVTEHLGAGRLRTTDVEPVSQEHEGHLRVIHDFLTWIDGGPEPETAISDNIYTAAISFAAVDAVRSRATVDIAAMVAAAGLPPRSPRYAP